MLESNVENSQQRLIVEDEINRQKEFVDKYDLPTIKQPASTGNLAKKVNLESEHKGLFKLFTKLVHPNSYLINNYEDAASSANRKTLQIHAQLYACDAVTLVCKELDIPFEISKPFGTET